MKITSVGAPAFDALTIDMATSFLKVRKGDDDTFIKQLINAAIVEVEEVTGFSLASKTYVENFDVYKTIIAPSIVNVTEVTSIQYLDESGVYQTLNSSFYELITVLDSAIIKFKYTLDNFPRILSKADCLKVTYKAGPLEQKDLKAGLVIACYIYIGHFYENRQAIEAPQAFYKYLASSRVRCEI